MKMPVTLKFLLVFAVFGLTTTENPMKTDFFRFTFAVFTCQAPLVARNVSLNPNQTVYDTRVTVEYSCGNSAALVGPSSASCDSQDTWSPSTIPLCVGKLVDGSIVNTDY